MRSDVFTEDAPQCAWVHRVARHRRGRRAIALRKIHLPQQQDCTQQTQQRRLSLLAHSKLAQRCTEPHKTLRRCMHLGRLGRGGATADTGHGPVAIADCVLLRA